MSWVVRAWPVLAASVVVTVAPVAAGVLFATPPSAPPPTRPLATTLGSLDTTTMAVSRTGFCDRLAAADVSAALGSEPTGSDAWDNGTAVALPGGGSDVAHEHGCRWTGDGGTAAAAWVFAPPVTETAAARLVAAAAGTKGCRRLTGAAAYGAPGVALTCPSPTAGLTTVSYRGLFGDAWLTCELTAPSAEAARTADRWCAAVLLASRAA